MYTVTQKWSPVSLHSIPLHSSILQARLHGMFTCRLQNVTNCLLFQHICKFTLQFLRNREHLPCFYQVVEHKWTFWRTMNAVGTQAAGKCFLNFFQVLPNFCKCFCSLIETQRTCFLFLLENTAMKKGKQFLSFDNQQVNSLCSCHHYINCLC